MRFSIRTGLLVATFMVALVSPVFAHHGPSTSGGGVFVRSSETLEAHGLSILVRWHLTDFEDIDGVSSDGDHEENGEHQAAPVSDVHGGDAGHFEALGTSLVQTAVLTHGVTSDFELSLATGTYRGVNLREIEDEGGTFVEHASYGDVSGLTDTWVSGKYRLLAGAVYGGIKLPTGRTAVIGVEDGQVHVLEPSVQPGSGAFDGLLGLAVSHRFGSGPAIDASAEYTVRLERNDFKIGDQVSGGVALSHRLGGPAKPFTILGEALVRHLRPNEEDGHALLNTGGTAVFVSVGARIRLAEHVSVSPSVQIPIAEHLDGTQQETEIKGTLSLSLFPLH